MGWGVFFFFLWDILVANVVVAMIVLFKVETKNMRFPAWVVIPVGATGTPQDDYHISTITLTRYEVSRDVSEDGKALLVHALDGANPERASATTSNSANEASPEKEIFADCDLLN